MRRALIDTHVFLWALTNSKKLPRAAWALLNDEHIKLHLSIASGWEVAIKQGLGKLTLPAPVDEFVATGCRAARVDLMGIDLKHLDEVSKLPGHHRDPFDRMLIAQARVERIPVLSYDRMFAKYDVDLLRP